MNDPEMQARVSEMLNERERFHFGQAIQARIEADPDLQDPAEQDEINNLFQARVAEKGGRNAAAWMLHFEDIRAERKAAKNAPRPEKPWLSMDDETFAKEEAALKAEKRVAIDSAQRTKRESLDKAADKVMKGDDDKEPDWLGMSDEEFEARDKRRAEIARKRLIEATR